MGREAGSDPLHAVLEYSRPALSVSDRTERRDIAKLAEVGKRMLLDGAFALVARNANGGVMTKVYGSDGTPLLTEKAFKRRLGSRLIVRRGRCGQEWLVDRSFIRGWDKGGTRTMAAVFREPEPLTNGKTSWALAACAWSSCPSLRAMGHFGPALTVYNFDRGYLSAMERLVRKRHRLEAEEGAREEKVVEGLLDFVLVIGDPMHDATNGFEWGMKPFLQGEVMKGIYVSVSAARSGYDIVMKELDCWLWAALSFVDETENEHVLAQLWSLLGVEEDVAEVLVRYRVIVKGGRLLVSSEYKNDPNLINDLASALVGVWRFVQFCESRWLSLGPTARAVVASELTGMSLLIEHARKMPGNSGYYIQGWKRRGSGGNAVCVIAALAAGPMEAALEELLCDDRVRRQLPVIEEAMRTAVERLQDIDGPIYDLLSPITDQSAWELRSAVMKAALTSVGFFNFRCLRNAREEPISLCEGDIRSNLLAMAAGPRPSEACSQQAWDLINMSFPVQPLVGVWKEMLDAPWSTVGIEQLHAGAAQVHKYHPSFQADALSARSFLWSLRSLVAPPSQASRAEELQRKLERLQAARPRRSLLSGRQVFLKEAVALAKLRQPAGGALEQDTLKTIMSKHAEQYRRLDSEQRLSYEKKALNLADSQAKDISEEIFELRTRISLEKGREVAEARHANPWRLSACRWGPIEKARFKALFESDQFSRAQVEALRGAAAEAPQLPDLAYKLCFSAIELPSKVSAPLPAWAREVCWRRHYFTGCVFKVQSADFEAERFFLMLWAFQSPLMLGLTRLERIAVDVCRCGDGIHGADAFWDYEFYLPGEFFYSDEGGMEWNLNDIGVLTPTTFLSDGRLVAVGQPLALADCIQGLPVPVKDAEEKSAEKAAGRGMALSSKSRFVQENPWAFEFLDERQQRLKREKLEHTEAQEPTDEVGEVEEVDSLGEAEALFEAMSSAREAVGEQEILLFRTRPLMGRWTLQNVGVPCDACQCRAVGEEAISFCLNFRIQQPLRFSTKLYGFDGALTCCRYWCKKLSFFYRLYMDSGAAGFPFTDEAVGMWEEPEDFTELAHLNTAAAAQARFAALRDLRPLAPEMGA